MRNGQQYLDSLADERTVFVDGERMRDVREHPATRGITRTIAGLYDTAADASNGLSCTAPETGRVANASFMIPRSIADLRTRREAITGWARQTYGFVGRGPDHVASFLAGFASAPELFARGRPQFGDNVMSWYRRLLDEDLYFTYVIIPPQVDRSKTAHGQEEAFLQVGAYHERDDGVVVRGAQMLGTGSAVCNYLFVSCIVPQRPGDEDYALSFVVSANAPGLRLYVRPPYALHKESLYDYPLSTRFDETDALVVFDDVFIPWEQVFVYRDVDLTHGQFFETAAHVLGNTQAQIRLIQKLKFITGVARKVAATNRIDRIPSVQATLADVASLAAMVEGMVLAAEATASIDTFGVARPNPRFLYAPMGLQAETYPRAVHLLRELVGGGVLQVPSSVQELLNAETQADIKRYARSTGVPSEERIKLFRLAWEIIGSEFGGRHQQYEMFHAGAPYVVKGYAFRNYGYAESLALVDEFLAGYDVTTVAPHGRVGANV